MERAGSQIDGLKLECRAYVDAVRARRGDARAAVALLGTAIKPGNLSGSGDRRATCCRAATNALTQAFYAERTGCDFGGDVAAVFEWLDELRPYAPYEALGWEAWVDQATLALQIVNVVSHFGELRVLPAALPAEHALLCDRSTLLRALKKKDVHLVGEIVRCLRVFGRGADDDLARRGRAFLVLAQTRSGPETGGWPARDGDATSYAAYHAAAHAISALYEPVFRGFGPSSPALRDALLDARTAACGAPLHDLGALEAAYKAGAAPVDPCKGLDLQAKATRRLAGLLKWHRAVQSRSIDDYDATAPQRMRKKRRLR